MSQLIWIKYTPNIKGKYRGSNHPYFEILVNIVLINDHPYPYLSCHTRYIPSYNLYNHNHHIESLTQVLGHTSPTYRGPARYHQHPITFKQPLPPKSLCSCLPAWRLHCFLSVGFSFVFTTALLCCLIFKFHDCILLYFSLFRFITSHCDVLMYKCNWKHKNIRTFLTSPLLNPSPTELTQIPLTFWPIQHYPFYILPVFREG